MKILVCGDRKWTDREKIRIRLDHFDPNNTILVHGKCPGADVLAASVARELGWPDKNIRGYPAKWLKYGKKAGPLRNTQMLEEEEPELVIAFHSNLSRSKGTKHCVFESNRRGILVEIIP